MSNDLTADEIETMCRLHQGGAEVLPEAMRRGLDARGYLLSVGRASYLSPDGRARVRRLAR